MQSLRLLERRYVTTLFPLQGSCQLRELDFSSLFASSERVVSQTACRYLTFGIRDASSRPCDRPLRFAERGAPRAPRHLRADGDKTEGAIELSPRCCHLAEGTASLWRRGSPICPLEQRSPQHSTRLALTKIQPTNIANLKPPTRSSIEKSHRLDATAAYGEDRRVGSDAESRHLKTLALRHQRGRSTPNLAPISGYDRAGAIRRACRTGRPVGRSKRSMS